MTSTKTTAGALGLFVGAAIAAAATVALNAWLLMLILGAIHSAADAVPAIGYGLTVLIVIGLSLVGGIIRGGGSKS